jgi:hypothetical protein
VDKLAATFNFTVPARQLRPGGCMPIQRLLSNEPFEPDDVARLISAYEAALLPRSKIRKAARLPPVPPAALLGDLAGLVRASTSRVALRIIQRSISRL